QQCITKITPGRMLAEVVIARDSTDPLIAPILWTACSLLQLSSLSSLLLRAFPSIPDEVRVRQSRWRQAHAILHCQSSASSGINVSAHRAFGSTIIQFRGLTGLLI
ncbi:MAG: hypothetical protein U0936_27485, partial [Planctomycetaceae bacterium]